MSSESSTRTPAPATAGFHARHFYLLLAMAGATWAVVVSPHTHPAALVLLSAAILAAGFASAALHDALIGFFTGRPVRGTDVSLGVRAALEGQKALVLRSLKELEFDRAMGKISESDFAELSGRLRARAVSVMADLDRSTPSVNAPPATEHRPPTCEQCGRQGDADARFCKHCGGRLSDTP